MGGGGGGVLKVLKKVTLFLLDCFFLYTLTLTLSEIKVQSCHCAFSKSILLHLLGSNIYTLSTNMYL